MGRFGCFFTLLSLQVLERPLALGTPSTVMKPADFTCLWLQIGSSFSKTFSPGTCCGAASLGGQRLSRDPRETACGHGAAVLERLLIGYRFAQAQIVTTLESEKLAALPHLPSMITATTQNDPPK